MSGKDAADVRPERPKRLFVAVELPRDLAVLLERLDPAIGGLRWTPAERLHLTLCFLGDTAEAARRRVIAALDGVAVAPFPVRVKGAGSFARRGGLVVWAGVEGEGLADLHGEVAGALRAAGIDPGSPRFHPHVTLARSRRGQPAALRAWLAVRRDEEFGRFTVNAVTLFSSVLTPAGPDYHVEHRRLFP